MIDDPLFSAALHTPSLMDMVVQKSPALDVTQFVSIEPEILQFGSYGEVRKGLLHLPSNSNSEDPAIVVAIKSFRVNMKTEREFAKVCYGLSVHGT